MRDGPWTLAAFVLAGACILVAATHARGQAAETLAAGIEISPAGEPAWSKETTTIWGLVLARPGDVASSEVLLRTTGATAPSDGLQVGADVPEDGGPLLDGLFVTRMELDGNDMLSRWTEACAGLDAALSLREFAVCADPPAFAPPATGDGSRFAMDIALAGGNRVQGQALEEVVVHFRLVTLDPTPTPTHTPAATSTPTASPTATSTAVATRTPLATPADDRGGPMLPQPPAPDAPSITPGAPTEPLFPRPSAATPTATTSPAGAVPEAATPVAPSATATPLPGGAPTPMPPETGYGVGGRSTSAAWVVPPLAMMFAVALVAAFRLWTHRNRGRFS